MPLLIHLSDLHLDVNSKAWPDISAALVTALETNPRVRDPKHRAQRLVLLTGDVFDSATMSPAVAIPLFLALHEAVLSALGERVPTILIPGNHDRRRWGLVGPQRDDLFAALRRAVNPAEVFVAGSASPFLAELVPPAFHRLAAHVIAYDSTFLPKGLVSAGGMIRQEDLLQVMAVLSAEEPPLPLILLMHHHLIPTPLTDVSEIDSRAMPWLGRWFVGRALPWLVSNGDREEMTMTALGAGTALSTLHALRRATLVLHGHKHFPTARLVHGLTEDSGDVLVASAGSCGRRERLYASRRAESARLWPSFNLVEIHHDEVKLRAVSFSPKGRKQSVSRRLAHVRREGVRWRPQAVNPRALDSVRKIQVDEAIYTISPSSLRPGETFDLACERRVERAAGAQLKRYVDFVHALPAARLLRTPLRSLAVKSKGTDRTTVDLVLDGTTRFEIAGAVCRSLAEAQKAYGPTTSYEWIGLLSRYGGSSVRLALAREGAPDHPFASITDLVTGRERPIAFVPSDSHWEVRLEDCAPRTLVKIYWPLERR
jgi:DNA repair exonuclease SbcCD nuclease subunit